MPDFGSPVAQNVDPAGKGLETLSGMLNVQSKRLGLQKQQQDLQTGANTADAAQQTMRERQTVTQMMQTGKDDQGNNIRNEKGEPDPSKILPALGRMAPLTGQQYAQSILQTHTTKTALDTAGLSLTQQQRAAVTGPLQSVAAGGDPSAVAPSWDALVAERPELKSVVDSARRDLLPHLLNATDPAQRAHLANSLAASWQGGQAVQTQPQSGTVNDGATTQPVVVAPPNAGGGMTSAPGAIPNQIPPTAPQMRNGVPGYKGDQSIASGPALGQAEGVGGPVAANNAHFAQVTQDAATAPNRIAALQTIKQEVPAAVTGGGDYRRKFVSQLSGLFGLANDAQTATDVMAKNLAVLAAQGGNTDASRALGEMANPSYHMTADAAKKTSDQLIGIESKKAAAQRFFGGIATNDPQYQQRLQQWNQNADPRAFEYATKSPADRAVMKSELLRAGTWAEIEAKGRKLHEMGVTP